MLLRIATLVAAVTLAASIFSRPSAATPPSGFELGIVSNAGGLLAAAPIGRLGAPVARVEFSIDSSPVRIAPVIAAFARHGVRVLLLAGFRGRIPTTAEARNLATWAQAFGAGGTFWRNRSRGDLAVRDIEFGNETNYGYQYGGCGPGCSGYVERARAYALALKDAQEAIDGPLGNPQVGVLAIADEAGSTSTDWLSGMLEVVPDLPRRIAGWTVHPYGPRSRWQPQIDRLVSETQARGAAGSVPIYITELGVASDNGPCLSDNYGWNPCMTYGQAASSLKSTLLAIRARYGERIHAIFIFQALDQRRPGFDNYREYYFGVLTSSGAAKGAYTATVGSLLTTLR